MAEASPCTSRFFCHRCSLEIIPRLPEYMCPQCESGFIEELLEERSADNGSMSTISSGPQNQQPLENMEQQLSMFPSGFGQFSVSVFDDTFDLGPGLGTEDNRDAENQSERDMSSRQRYGARQSRSRHGSRRQAGRHDGAPTLEGIIQQLVNGIIGPPANIGVGAWGVLHSNPMDYAWGANGLDAIITQLLNQFENSGPPPADGDKIKSLPTVEITDEHVASGLECPVCKEDYSVGENVRQLPCNHMFHNDCIVPWLEQHDTCPVCRTSLSGLNTATNPPELSEMNFTSSPSSSSSSSSSSSTSSSPPSSDSTSNESSTDNSNVNNGRADACGAASDWEDVEKRENFKRFMELKAPLKRGESKGRRPGAPRQLAVFL